MLLNCMRIENITTHFLTIFIAKDHAVFYVVHSGPLLTSQSQTNISDDILVTVNPEIFA